MQDENPQKMELLHCSERVDAELKDIGLKVNYHEKHLEFLNAQMEATSESILDLQVKLGNYNKSHVCEETRSHEVEMITVKHTIEQILRQGNTAAGIVCKLKFCNVWQASRLAWTKDVVGVVATLGSVKDYNLSRLLSEYLGLETMSAVVCKTHEGVKALEKYDKGGMIDKDAGLHDLGLSIGRHLDGRFLAISLENLRAYQGKFLADDPQKRLDLLKPRLPDGKCPQGFLGYAVNMIDLDHNHLSFLTSNGHGLRETLFYKLFFRLQVYKSRAEMEHAMPLINDGAVSLDGGIIRSNGRFYLGGRKDDIIRFPTSSLKENVTMESLETHAQLEVLRWNKEKLAKDIRREEVLLKQAKDLFHTRREELKKILNDAYQYILKDSMED